jgi:arylsulfatase A-like enzyme
VQTYDAIKVQAVLGMNFQAVSVAQKLPNAGSPLDPDGRPFIGGYAPDGSFDPNLSSAMRFVDASLGKMVEALGQAGVLDSTEIIVTAKHGQSPIDPQTLHRVSPDRLPGVVTSTTGATFPDPTSGFNQRASVTEDDVGIVWLSSPFQSKTPDLLAALDQPDSRQAGDIGRVISGRRLRSLFGDPKTDPRVPDAIVQPRDGGLYSFSKKKVAEHGGGANDDRHVALLVAGPAGDQGQTNDEPVTTTQVAPTILSFLGIGPRRLDAVRREGTQALPDQAGGD